MTKVLFVAYQFPPIGGPGVQRSTQFVRYLKEFGYEPVVLTISIPAAKKIESVLDESLLEYIPSDVKIYRVGSAQPIRLIKFLTTVKLFRIFWYLFYPIFWERSALWPFIYYFRAKKIMKKENIDLVYTSSAPFSSMILGFLLQKSGKINWVADLRDPYTDAYAWSFPSKVHWLISKIIEGWMLKKPNILIVNTPEVKKLFLKKHKLHESKIKVITNGF